MEPELDAVKRFRADDFGRGAQDYDRVGTPIFDALRDPATFWIGPADHRLRLIKAATDPSNTIRSNHPIQPAG